WQRDDAPPAGVVRGVVIPDVRWPGGNEGRAVYRRGGHVVFLRRPTGGLQGEAAKHDSELNILIPPEAYVLDNDQDLHWLHLLVDRMHDQFTGRIIPYDEEQKDVPPFLRK